MVKFIINFIVFGIIFFLIHRYIPTVFDQLVSWLNQGYDFLVGLVMQLVDKLHQSHSYSDPL